MTSKSSFWGNCIENHKRRIWVWVVSLVIQLAAYAGVLTVYLSRVSGAYAEGRYKTYELYRFDLCSAAVKALGFGRHFIMVVLFLAAAAGAQGFGYLNDRRKVDLYYSVPVDKKRRFLVIYGNGIAIYVLPAVLGILIGSAIALPWDAMTRQSLVYIAAGFVRNLLLYLTAYHTTVLAVMLTGNRFVALGLTAYLLGCEWWLYGLLQALRTAFYHTATDYWQHGGPKLSVLYDYLSAAPVRPYSGFRSASRAMLIGILPYYGKWIILALVLLALSWLAYCKRPPEAAQKALAFGWMKPAVKIFTAVPGALQIGVFVYGASGGSALLMLVGALAGGVLICGAMEVLYEFDIRRLAGHLWSDGVTLALILAVYAVFRYDMTGYDKYVPEPDRVESYAVNLGYSELLWDEEGHPLSTAENGRDHMFLTDAEAVVKLAQKAQKDRYEDMAFPQEARVLYRLKSGRQVQRRFWVDLENPANEELLNRIVGTPAYKTCVYQIMADSFHADSVKTMTYRNGAAVMALQPEDAAAVAEAYRQDMEAFDFSTMLREKPCGLVEIRHLSQYCQTLPVYESFRHTTELLQSLGVYYPLQLPAEEIENISVTRYDTWTDDESGEVLQKTNARADFDEEGQIREILAAVYPAELEMARWPFAYARTEEDYSVYITFKRDSAYPYARDCNSVYYLFGQGQVPEAVDRALDRAALQTAGGAGASGTEEWVWNMTTP